MPPKKRATTKAKAAASRNTKPDTTVTTPKASSPEHNDESTAAKNSNSSGTPSPTQANPSTELKTETVDPAHSETPGTALNSTSTTRIAVKEEKQENNSATIQSDEGPEQQQINTIKRKDVENMNALRQVYMILGANKNGAAAVPRPLRTPSDWDRAHGVVYLRDDNLALCDFSLHVARHVMKPYRLRITHALCAAMQLGRRNQHGEFCRVAVPPLLPKSMLSAYHEPTYIAGIERFSHESWEQPNVVAAGAKASETAFDIGIVPLKYDSGSENAALEASKDGDVDTVESPQKKKTSGGGSLVPACDVPPYSPDCPLMEDLIGYCQRIAGGSVFGASLLCTGRARTVIHWGGGMHHARSGCCAGFCYVNDIVLAILEMLKGGMQRVLYIDLDVHHGDGVEEAFYASNQVMTLSLHKFGDGFFPGTGHPTMDVGIGLGKYFSLNIGLGDGISDTPYVYLFRQALYGIMESFRPEAIVLQCGADSLAGDRVGVFNLSSVGHGECVRLVKALNLPLLVLGGGGYAVTRVAKLWAYETAILCSHYFDGDGGDTSDKQDDDAADGDGVDADADNGTADADVDTDINLPKTVSRPSERKRQRTIGQHDSQSKPKELHQQPNDTATQAEKQRFPTVTSHRPPKLSPAMRIPGLRPRLWGPPFHGGAGSQQLQLQQLQTTTTHQPNSRDGGLESQIEENLNHIQNPCGGSIQLPTVEDLNVLNSFYSPGDTILVPADDTLVPPYNVGELLQKAIANIRQHLAYVY